MLDKICEVPCKAVSDILQDKVSLKIFIVTVVLILSLGGYMAKQIGEINVSVAKIETQLQMMNGGDGRK
ncbi:hypothetical protein LCGC14_2015660 [marine sediment metagenome]|uniref:Chemotaxis methyl-accepting receptor HlyB-like 4HB MCP domain-containing protein n=1 Tax=marine sediment metagenome TaxID=412755 RepID=A0A0F9EZ79_9ZZZZ